MRTALFASLVVAGGCEVTATQLLVFVETDLDPGAGEIDGFDLAVRGPDHEPVALDQDRFSLDEVDLPASFGVAPRGRDPGRDVEVEVGARIGEDVLFSTRAHTTYVEHDVQRLDLFLARRCRTEARVCESLGLTCDQGGCRDPDAPPSTATGATPEWERVIAAPLLDPFVADRLRVGVDGASNIVVAGSFTGTLALDGAELEDRGSRGGVVVELPAEGEGARWVRVLHSGDAGFVEVRGVAVDPSTGQTTVGGTFAGALVMDALRVESVGAQDGFVVTLDDDGQILDHQTWGTVDGDVIVEDVAVGLDGARVISGSLIRAELRFGDAEIVNDSQDPAAFAALLDGPGAFACALPGVTNASGVAMGGQGRIIVAGIGDDSSRRILSMGTDCVAGGLTLETSGGSEVRVDVDPTGRAIAVGGMYEVGYQGAPLEGGQGGSDGLVVSLAPDGSVAWHKFLTSAASDDVHDLAVSPEGTVYVAGSMEGPAEVDGWDGPLPQGSNSDGLAAAFAADGTTLWARSWATEVREHWSGVAYDPVTGAVVLVGYGFGPPVGGGDPSFGVAIARLVP